MAYLRLRRSVACVVALAILWQVGAASAGESGLAGQLVKSSGVEQGLALVLDDADGELTAEFAKASKLYVQGCTWQAKDVPAARQALVAAGVADRASMAWIESEGLPYADNLVNLIVSANWKGNPALLDEALRVLAPGGVALFGNEAQPGSVARLEAALKKAGVQEFKTTPGKGWVACVKPPNPDFAEWTHIYGGPDQSYVSEDKAAGPWAEVRWIGSPRWGALRSAYHGRVTGGGRLYYLENRAKPGGGVETWLAARDAWNGSDLWRESIGSPPKYGTVGATLTCDERQVYCLEGDKTLTARDGRTGSKVMEYAPGFRATVVTSVGSVLLACDLGISPAIAHKVVAMDKASGKILWSRPGVTQPPAENGTAFVLSAAELEGVDVATGASRWKAKAEAAPGAPRAFCKKGVVYVTYTQPWKPIGLLVAYDAKNGSVLWKKETPPCGYGALPDGDEFWMLVHTGNKGGQGDSVQATVLDARSGSVKREFRAKGTVNSKCYPSKGCADYLLYSNSWTLDEKSGTSLSQDTVRAPCDLGQMPANGMTYYFPHHCDCQVTLRGMLAMARAGKRTWLSEADKDGAPRLFASNAAPAAAQDQPADWPMYRKDIARSNCATAAVPGNLQLLWSKKPGASRLTQAVSAYGVVCTTVPDEHRVVALDAASGKELWSFVADGRTEWPAAFHKGLCLFGTAGGSVYALDAKTGREVWRMRAAPTEKYIAEESQFASAWPVVGGVMPMNGEIFFTCGRAGGVDGGIHLYAADAASGKIRWRVRGGSSGDMFLSDGKELMLTRNYYSIQSGGRIGGAKKHAPLLQTTSYLTPVSVLDYMACVEPLLSGEKHIELTDGASITGENLAFCEKFSVAAWRYRFGVPKEIMKKEKAGKRFIYAKSGGSMTWLLDEEISQQMLGVVLAGDCAYMAGVPVSLEAKDKSELWVLSMADGKIRQTVPLEGRPVYDGLSAAGGRLYLSQEDGTLSCLGGK